MDKVTTIDEFLSIGREAQAFMQQVTSPTRIRHRYERTINIRKRRSGVYSPSGIGYCKARQLFRRRGVLGAYNIKPKTQGVFDFGHALHNYWQEQDKEILGSEHYEAEVPVEIPELHLFGTCDAEVTFSWVAYLYEYKTINGESFKSLVQPLPQHVKQLTAYMKARNKPFGWIRYICKVTGQIKDFFVPFMYEVWSQVESLLLELEEHYRNGTDTEKTVGYQCGECQYILECNPYEK